MKKHYLMLSVTLLAGLSALLGHADIPKQSLDAAMLPEFVVEKIAGDQSDEEQQPEFSVATDLTALVPQKCWSARKCKGKVLNNLAVHQCKNSGGKSWNDNQGQCFKL